METTTAQAFAERVLAAFEQAGRSTDAQVAAAGGPSNTTMTKFRSVARGESDMAEPREPTWTKIDLAASWAPGSSRRVWRGQEPVAAGLNETAFRKNALNRVMPQVVADLEERVDELEQLVEILLIIVGDGEVPAEVGEELRARRNATVHHFAGSGKTAAFAEMLAARQGRSVGREAQQRQDLESAATQDPGGMDPS